MIGDRESLEAKEKNKEELEKLKEEENDIEPFRRPKI